MESIEKDKVVKDIIESKSISSIGDYIGIIGNLNEKFCDKKTFAVYRGEPQYYEHPCRPNIFRDKVLQKNPFYERNILDVIKQNNISSQESYLELAIDAQHGEFPSRLLDVSYNCLVALYFAVTPYYHKPENEYDSDNGYVYFILIDEIFSPSADNTKSAFNNIVNRKEKWFVNPLFSNNHKFIDYSKQNSRIIAQQGAFILFQGDSVVDLPDGMVYRITIPKEKRAKLRAQLKSLFGIHTGTIYPESTNMVNLVKEKSSHIVDDPFSAETEVVRAINAFKRILNYYLQYMIRNPITKEKQVGFLFTVGKVIRTYKRELDGYYLKYNDGIPKDEAKRLFDDIVNDFIEEAQEYCNFTINDLRINEVKENEGRRA